MNFIQSVGRFAKKAAPFAALIPGVGPLVAAGIGAGGAILEKGTKAKLLKDVVGSGAKAYGAGKLAGIGRGGDVLAGKSVPGVTTATTGGTMRATAGPLSGVLDSVQAGAQASPSLLSRVGKFAGNNWKDILTGAGAYQQQRSANKAADRIEQMALERERRLRPIGDRGLAMLQQSELPPVPDDLAIDATNPYAIRRAGRFR